jgi:hypothetical protein
MTLGISHVEGDALVLDHLSVRHPPFDPESCVREFVATLKRYRLTGCTGDRYAAEWVSTMFAKCGASYSATDRDKSAIYVEALPLFTQKRARLLDHSRLLTELRMLERRPRPGGKGDLVDHPPRASDDCANSALGSLWLASRTVSGAGAHFIAIRSHVLDGYHDSNASAGYFDSHDSGF